MSHNITFGTDGWRAVMAEDFTFANVERVAYAIGQYVKNSYHKGGKNVPVLVGYDTRFQADAFAKRVAQVLITMGVPAKLSVRDVPTPSIAWSVQLEPTAGAVQLTASHNPPEYCGIKYIPDFAGPATNEITTAIVSHLQDLPADFEVQHVEVPTYDPRPPYLAVLETRVDWERIKKAGLKIACDTVYSTSRDYLDHIMVSHGLNVKVLHNWRDPLFGGGMPEPKPEYLKELIATVVNEKYDLGVATDGDADRFGVIDDKGEYVSPNMLLALLLRHLVKNKKQTGTVVRTVATTHLIDQLAKMYNLPLVETPVGFKYIGEVMRQQDVLIGGEESGGVSVKGHIPEKDGILANLLLIEMLAFEGKPLSQVWATLLDEAGMHLVGRRRDLHLTKPVQKGLMERLTSAPFDKIGSHKVTEVGRKDGLKFYIDHNNWVLVRASGTEPLIRLYFEGTDAAKVDDILESFTKQVDGIISELSNGARQPVKAK